ncbi:hypothetical protein SanaruYs_06110 [Chryseotalea sanaruensis]|uniref:Response regulatory domain-containing protein n=1 Tax=Chryseotalea sanaruensis TaxID=2482724 RepID=A0A401U6H2_9BACT|nr:response regulator [Chryseotalea sanaruensis]GCC50396.1 hypothetical protein SanaruYs_06110 [Chryseotalea sanaruensis]
MRKVLIIEDNLEVRENTVEILELKGFSVISAENGKEGIAKAEIEKPDIILCDIIMPDIDGYRVIKELKAHPITAKIPFIYVTASGEKSEVKLAMNMGANAYVRKPFDVNELIEKINECFA